MTEKMGGGGGDARPKGFLAPTKGDRPDDPDWLRFRLLGATNPTYFGLYARRRMALYGATRADFARIKVKNSRHGSLNDFARYTFCEKAQSQQVFLLQTELKFTRS